LDKKSLLNSVLLSSFSKLWESFQHRDKKRLIEYGAQCKSIIPRINQVVQAHIERSKSLQGLGRPEKTIHDILNEGKTTFPELFKEFSKRDGIYGFGDLQVKRMFDKTNE